MSGERGTQVLGGGARKTLVLAGGAGSSTLHARSGHNNLKPVTYTNCLIPRILSTQVVWNQDGAHTDYYTDNHSFFSTATKVEEYFPPPHKEMAC